MEKRLIAILSVSLMAALLVIAFMAGRMSVKPNGPTHETVAVSGGEKPAQAAPVSSPTVEQRPGPGEKDQLLSQNPSAQSSIPQSPRVPDAKVAFPREEHTDARPRPSDTGSAAPIASYFAKIDAIQVPGTGDPTAFAQGILGGLQNGDSSQIDKLVNDAKHALAQATEVRPPSACAEYHRRLIESLSESVAGLEKFRTAIEKSDLNGVASVVAQLQGAQQKINNLESMRKQLLAQ